MANLSLFARLGLDTKAFSQGINQAQKKAGGFKNMLGGLGAQLTALASVGGLVLASRRAIQLGRDMDQLANRTNTTVESFMSLRAAAMDSGSSQQTLERALRNVNARTVEATRGNKAYGDAIEELGLNVEQFAAMSVEQRFEAIAKSVANADDEMRALAIASRILGERAGPELLETMRQVGSEGLDPLVAKMKAAGRVIDKDAVAALENLDTNLGALRERFTIFVAVLIARVTPALMKVIDFFNENWRSIGRVARILAIYVGGLYIARRAMIAYIAVAKGFAAAKIAMAAAVGFASKAMVLFRVALAKTGLGLAIVAAAELAVRFGGIGKAAKESAKELDEFAEKTERGMNDVADVFDDLEEAGQRMGQAGADGFDAIGEAASETQRQINALYADWLAAEAEIARQRDERDEIFLRQQELEMLRARARGEEEVAEQIKKQIEYTREVLRLSERLNITTEEAGNLLRGINQQEQARADAAAVRSAAGTGEGLLAAANVAGKGAGATFQPMDDGNFQRFINGEEAGVFSDEELRSALRDRLADDASEKLLGDIVEALRGRFVNE
jgi:hypothetical protein